MHQIVKMPRPGRSRLSRAAGRPPYLSRYRVAPGQPWPPLGQQLCLALLRTLFGCLRRLLAPVCRRCRKRHPRSPRPTMRILPMLLGAMLLAELLAPLALAAQHEAQAHTIAVGDTLPEAFWQAEYQFLKGRSVAQASLAPYRGSWLLLDFWATWCTPCIRSFTEMDSLRHALQGKLEVVLVNKEDHADRLGHIAGFLEERQGRFAHGLAMPKIIGGHALKRYFPFKVIPHYVLISGEGIVLAMGSATAFNAMRVLLRTLGRTERSAE